MGHILLVEDDSDAAALIRRCVENVSPQRQLAVFDKSADALSYAQDYPIDLFILDIQLLDYKGTVLARQLRTMPRYQFTPILFTTELANEELSAYRAVKCYDFIVKPFSEADFRQAFLSALKLGEQLQAPPRLLRIEQKQFLFEYDVKNILYIESFGKRTVIHTTAGGGEVADSISGYSLSRLLELAGAGRLLQCHRSFLVNPERICKIDKNQRLITLTGCGTPIPIGDKFQRALWERAGC